ncbi:MAG: hypothetical protein JOY98_15545 [Candidatus Eremiobacteraeota bacterium]|nr:hypothetical protein [Candidatus Eremiobacteraeota bacterium]
MALAAAVTAGCANGVQSLPAVPLQSGAGADGGKAQLTVVARFPASGGADFKTGFPRSISRKKHYAHAHLAAGMKVWVYADVYPSYADYRGAYWSGPVTLGKGGTVTVAFGSVPRANNEWAVISIYQYVNNNGGNYLGTEAGLLNVGKHTTTVTVTASTTLLFQAVMGLADAGFIAASDLANPSLTKTVAAQLKASGIVPDPSTGLYDETSLATFVVGVKPQWQRVVTVQGGSTAKILTISNDVADVADTYAVYNQQNYLNDRLAVSSSSSSSGLVRPAGYPCYEDPLERAPGHPGELPPRACAKVYTTAIGSITVPVFGGSVIAGATNDAVPFTGASLKITGGAPGTKSTATLTQIPTQVSVTTSDPEDWAFGGSPNIFSNLVPTGIPVTTNGGGYYSSYYFSNYLQMQIPSTYSSVNPNVLVNSWNAWGLPLSNFELCTDVDSPCTAFPITGTYAVDSEFYDNGKSGTYYNWQGESGTVVTYSPACHGYVLTPSGGKIVMTTSTTSYFVDSQSLTAHFIVCGGGGVPAAGSSVVVTATDSLGNVYSGIGRSPGYNLRMNTSANRTTANAVTITITLGAGSPPQIFMGSI